VARTAVTISAARLAVRAIRRLPLHDTVVAALREMIQNSELTPGAKINEADLCASFAISRTPLREALKVLASEGLVELRLHRGAAVTQIDPAEIAAVFQVMVALERLAGELACRNASDADISGLEAQHADLVALHRQGARVAYFQRNREIHASIVALAGNPFLEATYANCATKITRARSLANYDAARWMHSVAEHEAVMQAFRARDPAAAADLLAEHSRFTAAAVLDALHRLAPEAPESEDVLCEEVG
jgi:DNA-binding GntR family transcriptional regulator